ncbi:MAG: hypothetical protein LC130_26085 [Bryobacterales bacterium]|nr:hypothetical protein [Bryobacterales bacterium]
MSDSERLTDEQLTAIAAADEKRTPGEWVYEQGREKVCNRTEFATIGVVCDLGAWDQTDADGFFIAVASWAIPALLREVAALRAERDEARQWANEKRNVLHKGSDEF